MNHLKVFFCQGMVCHKTYKGKDGWLEPSEIELKGNKAFNEKKINQRSSLADPKKCQNLKKIL